MEPKKLGKRRSTFILVALATAALLAGCGGAGAGGDGGGGGGSTVVGVEAPITSIEGNFPGCDTGQATPQLIAQSEAKLRVSTSSGDSEYLSLGTGGTIDDDGDFLIQLPTENIPEETLWEIDDQGAYDDDTAGGTLPDGFTITPPDSAAKIAGGSEIIVDGEDCFGTLHTPILNFPFETVAWFFSTEDVRVHGAGVIDGDNIEMDLRLKAGWNRVIGRATGPSNVAFYTGSRPATATWNYYSD